MGGGLVQNVRLSELLDEAKERCQATIKDRREDIGDDELDMASSAMGYGAIKYADLKNHRTTNYKQALFSIPPSRPLLYTPIPPLPHCADQVVSAHEQHPQGRMPRASWSHAWRLNFAVAVILIHTEIVISRREEIFCFGTCLWQ